MSTREPLATAYSARLHRALAFAARAHRAQQRKGTDIPYVTHPVQVAWILDRHGFGEDVLVAALLHDVVEDTDVPLAELVAAFGERVGTLVAGVTERKSENGKARPWRERKEEALRHLAEGPRELVALKVADALHNCSTLVEDLASHGESVWARFHAGPVERVWYFGEIARIAALHLGTDHPLLAELRSAVAQLARR